MNMESSTKNKVTYQGKRERLELKSDCKMKRHNWIAARYGKSQKMI
jgi:hypothetical protein